MRKGFKGTDLGGLPWIIINNSGILKFLEGDFESALNSYAELNERIPLNIIFLYRLGLCHGILAFLNQKHSLFGRNRPDPTHLKEAIKYFQEAIHIGESRSIGKQKCLTIRKVLADILEKAGHSKLAREVWRQIVDLQPRSLEAAYKLRPGILKLLNKKV